MAVKRDSPPDVVRVSGGYVSERLRLEREHDERNPDFKHVWVKTDKPADALERQHMEPVRDDSGRVVTDGLQMLCRVPRSVWQRRIDEPAERSLERMRSISKNFEQSPAVIGSLVKKRSPRRPGGE